MRRFLPLALALLLSSPAHAGRGMLVQGNAWGGLSPSSDLFLSQSLSAFQALGMDIDRYPQGALKTQWVIDAQYRGVEGVVKNYDYVIIMNYRNGQGSPSTGACNLDSIFRTPGGAPRWPTKPTVLMCDPNTLGTNMWAPPGSAGDSLGFGTNPAPIGAMNWPMRVEFSPLTMRGWHTINPSPRFPRVSAPGVIRDILLDMPSPWNLYQHLLPNGIGRIDGQVAGWSTPDWDSVAISANDSALIRVRYRADGNNNGIQPPFITVGLGPSTRIIGNLRRMVTALSIADSASGGRVFFQTRPGPVTFTVQCNTIGATGRYDATDGTGIANDYGIFVPAGVDSDRAGAVSTIDALAERGVNMSFGVQCNPDSVALYRYQHDWLLGRYPNAKVYPFERSGLGDYLVGGPLESAGGNADATHNYDAFGAQRHRGLIPAGCADPRLGCDCSTDTTSILCLLQRQRAAAVAIYGETRIDPVWSAPIEDWTPKYFGRQTASIDSLVWVLWLSKIRGIRVGNMSIQNLSTNAATGSPRGWFRNEAIWPVSDPVTRSILGEFVFLPSRDAENNGPTQIQSSGHDNASEFLAGLFTGMWFEGFPSPIYSGDGRHDFFNRTMIFEVPASWLGGSGDPRYEWHAGLNFVADFDDFQKLVNRLAGREVIHVGWGYETANWFIRSGLR